MNPEHNIMLLIGLILGVLYNTGAPYQSKMKAGKIEKFDPRYLWSALAALIGATVTAFQMFSGAALAWADGWPFGTGYVALLVFGFFWAIGFNQLLNQFAKAKEVMPELNTTVVPPPKED